MPAESIQPKEESPSPDQAAIAAIIARSKPEDYDGHTEFDRLSPQERLEWLDAAVQFIESRRARVRGTIRTNERHRRTQKIL
jgi:hypothetical protein